MAGPSENTASSGRGANFGERLRRHVSGEVRFDTLARTLYSTDAGIYEITPTAVVLPRTIDDVVTTVNLCRECQVPLVPRGAGTGLTGGAVGSGVQLDLSRYLHAIGHIDPTTRTARVQAGVVLDDLNAALAPHGLQFAPDVATSSRATIGGMIANNSCGAHSIIYGRTVDHLVELTGVLSDGSVVTWDDQGRAHPSGTLPDSIAGGLADIRDRMAGEIAARFPHVLRSNGGYGLDRLLNRKHPLNPAMIVCGSEGTLAVVVDAVVRLTPLPKNKGLLLVHFASVLDAVGATPIILQHQPAAVELVDHTILRAVRDTVAPDHRPTWLSGPAPALLIIELFDDAAGALGNRLDALCQRLRRDGAGTDHFRVIDPTDQAAVWDMRKRGLGLLMSRPGDRQPYGFIEDAAVDPSRLREYLTRLDAVLQRNGVHEVSHYAHASVGCIHVRPVLNLKDAVDIDRLRRIAEETCELVLEFGGAMTGEHGDGIVRSGWIDKMYGPRIAAAFREVKQLFDPDGVFNPGKIVDPLPLTENLRYGANFATQSIKTTLDFAAYDGPAGMAGMCSGVGACRQRFVGTMCPSFQATRDETHTTRARANALRVALSNRGLLDGLADDHLSEAMDLCLSCKACKTECPTGVDMARLKAEWLAHRNRRVGVDRRSRLIADTPSLAVWGSRFAPLSNWIAQSRPVRRWMERRYGLDRRVPPPRFVRHTFRHWYRRHRRQRALHGAGAPRGRVYYFVDTWTKHHCPEVGVATVRLLEAAGFDVIVPALHCCGRPAISKGLLDEARLLARENVETLARLADQDAPIVGTEPSCILTFVDEYPQLVRTAEARTIASRVCTVETFLARLFAADGEAIRFSETPRRIIYHGHCHQKALVGTDDALAVLNHPPAFDAALINSGCCGMAGSFGHEVEHYEVARAIGEERLFPAVRSRGGTDVAVSGFSCRQQIAHHTDAVPRHVVEYLADALLEPQRRAEPAKERA